MRTMCIVLCLLALAGRALATDAYFAELIQDKDRAKEIGSALKLLKAYYKAEIELEKQKKPKDRAKWSNIRDDALAKFRVWLENTPAKLGVDLRGKPATVIEILDRGRVDFLARPKQGLQYVQGNAKGLTRGSFEYTLLPPKGYSKDNDDRYPLVISLHERVINPRHPAFRASGAAFEQRSRQTVFDNWLKTPAADKVLVLAPTGNPNGFRWDNDPAGDRQTLYRALFAGLGDYRIDWDRVFVEVYGSALRAALQDTFLFAGFIVREREDDRQNPILPAEEFFLLENLNGIPLCYIADEANWDRIGKPVVDALTKAYAKAESSGSLVILKGKRDANGALQADDAKIAEFLSTHQRVRKRAHFRWRYVDAPTSAPLPLSILRCNFPDLTVGPADKLAGALEFKASASSYKDSTEERPLNLIEIKITEAEKASVLLDEVLFDLNHPISIVVNGKVVVDKKKVDRDWDFFFSEIFPTRAFMMAYVANLPFEFELLPQVKPEKPAETPGEKPAEAPAEKVGGDDAQKQDAAGEESK